MTKIGSNIPIWYRYLNAKIDNGADVTAVTRVVNGGTSKLAERKAAYNKIKSLL